MKRCKAVREIRSLEQPEALGFKKVITLSATSQINQQICHTIVRNWAQPSISFAPNNNLPQPLVQLAAKSQEKQIYFILEKMDETQYLGFRGHGASPYLVRVWVIALYSGKSKKMFFFVLLEGLLGERLQCTRPAKRAVVLPATVLLLDMVMEGAGEWQ